MTGKSKPFDAEVLITLCLRTRPFGPCVFSYADAVHFVEAAYTAGSEVHYREILKVRQEISDQYESLAKQMLNRAETTMSPISGDD